MKDIIKSILSMVNDGKITAEEGVKLINAVKATYNPNYEAAKKMKNKMKKAVKDAEPKVKKAAGIIWDKSVEAVDGLSKGVKTVTEDIGERINAGKAAKRRTASYYDDMDFVYEDDDEDDEDWDEFED